MTRDTPIVDCDVHTRTIPEEVIEEKLPPRYAGRGLTLPTPGYANPHGRTITDFEDDPKAPGRFGPADVVENHLDEYGIEYGIVTGSTLMMSVALHPNRDYAAEVARVHNEYVAETWLPADDRFRGSVLVAPQAPERAVEQIEEYGPRDGFVQVIMASMSDEAYGHPKFWPVYEAAEKHDLPVAIHTSNDGAGLSSPATPGQPTNYFSWHNMIPAGYMGHVNSLIVEGVFDEFPGLTFVCVEGGFAWVPHLMWRMDKNWKGLREQAPWLENPPSRYIRDHVRFTTQPVAEPENDDHLLQILEMMHADETLMFSADYPHWDTDDPRLILPNDTPTSFRDRIMHGNAQDVYDL
ncbi:amidohydrolase family protein [Natronorubrum sp. FCH18a]|uniref:amidohydrolase family protein n=1 Tax=Natronorubrum sp. FCH18a TaxID=3447018 RepID=UPI003F5155C7